MYNIIEFPHPTLSFDHRKHEIHNAATVNGYIYSTIDIQNQQLQTLKKAHKLIGIHCLMGLQ